MQVYYAGIQELSSVDYSGLLCSVIFFQGCNLKCRFCYNASNISICKKTSLKKLYDDLSKNLGVINAVMLSGGEAMIHDYAIIDIKKWCTKHNLKLGVETNGTFYKRLKNLMKQNVFDFVAMDIKSNFSKEEYKKVTGFSTPYAQFIKSFEMVKKSGVPHEFRMTVTPTLHTLEDIKAINKVVKPSKLILQRFQAGEGVLDKSLNDKKFSVEFLKELKKYAKSEKNIEMRFWE